MRQSAYGVTCLGNGCHNPPPPALLWLGAAFMLSLLFPAATLWAQQNQVGISHTWTRVYYGELDGKERLLFGGGFERAKSALGDLDLTLLRPERGGGEEQAQYEGCAQP